MKIDFELVSLALSKWYTDFVNDLATNAKNTYIATSIAADAIALRKHRVVSPALQELGYSKARKVDTPMINDLKKFYAEKSVEFVDPYKRNLMNGGRWVNIGRWGDRNTDDFKEYEGYKRKWVPWLEEYDKSQREQIYSILTSGRSKEEISGDLQRNFQMRQNYANLIARTETYNNASIIKRERWDDNGYEYYQWICSHHPNSPCEDLCAQFCGRTFHRLELPFNGELAHPNCRCTIVPVLKDTIPSDWAYLKNESTWAERLGDEPRFVQPEYKSPFLKDQVGYPLPTVPILDADKPGFLTGNTDLNKIVATIPRDSATSQTRQNSIKKFSR